MDINSVFDTLFSYYNVSTFTDLAKKMKIGQSAISKWKKNNSIDALKKKCRELGIFNDIFLKTEIVYENYGEENDGEAQKRIENYRATLDKIFSGVGVSDNITNALYLEAYEKAKMNNKLNEFRIHLMNF